MKAVKKLILLDVHAILHRAYHALPGFVSSKGEPTGALYGLSAFLIKVIADFKPDYIVACYDLPGPTFRKRVYEEYKAKRAKTPDELISQLIRSKDIFKAFNIPVYEKEGFEADDIIGTVAETAKKEKDLQTIIASGDMDTMQLVDDDRVVVYTLRKGLNDTVIYNEPAVVERFGFTPSLLADYKGLRGDPSDNIIGVEGIGEKTATELIKNFGSIEDLYSKIRTSPEELEKAGIKKRIIQLLDDSEEEALFSKMLATIKRDVPIDFSLLETLWLDGFKLGSVKKIFQELEFKTLGQRLETVLGLDSGGVKDNILSRKEEELSDADFRKLAIAVWLRDSNVTGPTKEDIMSLAGASHIKDAEEKILKSIKDDGLEDVYYKIELPLIPIIKEAEKLGILIDKDYLRMLSVDYHEKLETLEKEIWREAGLNFNINSPKQLAEVLFDKMGLMAKGLRKTPGGARSTKESELLKLKDTHPIIGKLLSYREIQKVLSTYIDPLPLLADKNGRLHTSLNQMGTTTGRMSSSDPNLQNIPSKGEIAREIRRAFIAPSGYKIVAFDYSQIEMRVLAWLSLDEGLTAIFKNGEDIHTAVAAKVFGVPMKDVTKDMRGKAKVINFGIIYGMGVSSLKKNLGGTMEEAEKFYKEFFEKFPKIKEFFERVKHEARTKGYTVTAFGRRRYFPTMNSPIPYVRAEAERMAVNAPIQGTATADIIKIAMSKVRYRLSDLGLLNDAKLLLQVHDELLYEVKEDKISEIVKIIKKEMESAVSMTVPLLVNVYEGDNWGDLKELK